MISIININYNSYYKIPNNEKYNDTLETWGNNLHPYNTLSL